MRILLAEDDTHALEICTKALELRGHEVVGVTNGSDCIRMYYDNVSRCVAENEPLSFNNPFDAVVLDYSMPGVDGKEAAKEILGVNPEQRIIFASAYVKDTLMESLTELRQVIELIQKPFEPDVLVDLVENVESAGLMRNLKALAGKIDDGASSVPTKDQIQELLDTLQRIQKVNKLS